MRTVTIDSFTIYHSPNAYLGSVLAARIIAKVDNIKLSRRPIFIPRNRGLLVADLVGGKEAHAMSAYHRQDCMRWASKFEIALKYPDRREFMKRSQRWSKSEWSREEFPARAYYAALGTGREREFDAALFEAAWVEGLDVNEPSTVEWAAARAELGFAEIMAQISAPETTSHLNKALSDFDRLQCPGVPTFVVGNDLFFGKDRLEWAVESCMRRLGSNNHATSARGETPQASRD